MLEPLCKVFFLCNVKSRSNRPTNDTGLGMYSVKHQHMNNQDSSPPPQKKNFIIYSSSCSSKLMWTQMKEDILKNVWNQIVADSLWLP